MLPLAAEPMRINRTRMRRNPRLIHRLEFVCVWLLAERPTYEPGGREFESLRARHSIKGLTVAGRLLKLIGVNSNSRRPNKASSTTWPSSAKLIARRATPKG
jgi:hypothetical protein